MKVKFISYAAAAAMLTATAFLGYGNFTSQNCPPSEACPTVINCPLKGTPDCPATKNCCVDLAGK